MFKVTTLDINNAGLDNANQIDYSKDFFGKETNLTVSGQLEAESMAMGWVMFIPLDPHLEQKILIHLDI